jgi:hypothetical protein
VKWLYSLGNINIHVRNKEAFRESCENRHLEVVKWFMFELGYINNPIIDEYIICQEIINELKGKRYDRKKNLMLGYIFGGGRLKTAYNFNI